MSRKVRRRDKLSSSDTLPMATIRIRAVRESEENRLIVAADVDILEAYHGIGIVHTTPALLM